MPSEWINLVDPDPDALRLVLPADIHPTAFERLAQPLEPDDVPRPRLETHDSYVFGILLVPAIVDGALHLTEVDVVVSPTRIVTIQKTSGGDPIVPLERVQAAATASGQTPGMCLHHLLDEIAERCLDAVEAIDEEIDTLEERIDDGQSTDVRGRVSELRHIILDVRRMLVPTRDAARAVLDDRVELQRVELFPRDVEIRFADVYDKLLRAADGLDLARELLSGVRDYHQSHLAAEQNEVIKRLTVVASVLLLPTFIVGLYGQNLHVPEFDWTYGYAWSWGLIVSTTIGQLVYFRRRGWF